MNSKNLYSSYNRSLHVFIVCIAALLGPFFTASGIDPEYERNLIFGLLLVGYFVFHLFKVYPNRISLSNTDRLAFLWVPVAILPLGLLLGAMEFLS